MKPVIIIGAPRSGTNMLRDVMCSVPDVSTWPCDEINYIWRYGSRQLDSDEIPVSSVTQVSRDYIRGYFEWVSRRYNSEVVVEKTCANSLRVPFVDSIFPDAKYIFIYRNAYDALSSAMDRWGAPLDLSYVLRKARFVPITDLPWYASRYAKSRTHRLFNHEHRLGSWGPRFEGIDHELRERPLDEICALQWAQCVLASANAFEKIATERWLPVSYESFVNDPESHLIKILRFCGVDANAALASHVVTDVNSASVGKGAVRLGAEAVTRLKPLICDATTALEKLLQR